ncbi:UDP-2,3-diacetamido-2,3-dideoxy-D-glucuronate 2-epimerase [Dyadobacter sp. CECT 9275]|uniref:UDP-2,3-diacetamido-2,3-dideoxy-D-glucuronate 2-epimerase n=1 Tax=Dyadobacter helix TaxID=2822344 RepID=A0A916JFB5_9BACT|nr:UDP-N-acetylglucosamine 2-epimerase (non-hydrolyzing) [Dyadobacter sp. CECT 9275]CAG4999621.1 UDP-2,3-diacetamido-2,3-dideoxy-D-glucuronate 2-epimerase [Dyadobacter sp. CECT 9275]
MLKLLTIIGARPQIIKAAALSRAIRNNFSDSVTEIIVHTGQHYDVNMSDQFFVELQIPQPVYNLGVGSGKHGRQTADMIIGLEEIMEKEKPDFLIIYGDTNSTLAAAITAAKIHIPIVHIEAGLRSFNKKMPEEINRILSDHVSTYLFPPTQTGYNNLVREGFRTGTLPPFSMDNPGIFHVGDVMFDNTLYFSDAARKSPSILDKLALHNGAFVLATLHRNTNTDDAGRLNAIFGTLLEIVRDYQVRAVLPLHPRTRKQMDVLLEGDLLSEIKNNPDFLLVPPVSFLEMIQLQNGARCVITDSGGVQKEAYFLNKPCIILRAETEWVEIVESGAAMLCDADRYKILNAFAHFEKKPDSVSHNIYGDGNAAEKILRTLLNEFEQKNGLKSETGINAQIS